MVLNIRSLLLLLLLLRLRRPVSRHAGSSSRNTGKHSTSFVLCLFVRGLLFPAAVFISFAVAYFCNVCLKQLNTLPVATYTPYPKPLCPDLLYDSLPGCSGGRKDHLCCIVCSKIENYKMKKKRVKLFEK